MSFRIDEKEDNELESLAKMMKTDKSTTVRRVIKLGIKELKLKEALEKVRLHEWTIWKAAKFCGDSYQSFLKKLRKENINFPISIEGLEREFNESSS